MMFVFGSDHRRPRLAVAVIAAFVTALAALALPTPARAATREGSMFALGRDDKCLDISGGSTGDGVQVQVWDCNHTAAQDWRLTDDGAMYAAAMRKCLTVNRGGTGSGTRVLSSACTGVNNPSQQWRLTPDNQLVNPNSGKCLDVIGASSANGTPTQLYDCNFTVAQSWVVGTTVPSVAFRDFITARDLLTAAGLTVGATPQLDDCLFPGGVSLQDPSAGTEKPLGFAVTLYLSVCFE